MRRNSEEDRTLRRIKSIWMRERFHAHVVIRSTSPEQLLQEYGGLAIPFQMAQKGLTISLPSSGYSEDQIKGVLDELNNEVKEVMQKEPNRKIHILVLNERSEEELEQICIKRIIEMKEAKKERQDLGSAEVKKKREEEAKKQEEDAKWKRLNEKAEAELAKRQSK